MTRKKSELVSSFGASFEIFKKLAQAVQDAGGNDSDLKKLVTDEVVRHKVSKLLVGELSKVGPKEYKVPMTRRKLSDGIRAGAYYYANKDINEENFPADAYAPGNAFTAVFVEACRKLPRERLDEEFERYGLSHGTLAELLAFDTAFPGALPNLTLFALGSSWSPPPPAHGWKSSPYVCDRVYGEKCERHRVLDMTAAHGTMDFERTMYLGIRRR